MFDTNILIDSLNGIEQAVELFVTTRERLVSVVVRAEVLSGTHNERAFASAQTLFTRCRFVDVDADIADAAAVLRRRYQIKLPDALIVATAQVVGQPLLTRDEKLLRLGDLIQIPYRLD